MLTRILTSAVGLVVFFSLLFIPAGPGLFNLAVFVVIAGMLTELYSSIKTHAGLRVVGYIVMAIMLMVMIFTPSMKEFLMPLCIVVYFISMVFLHKKVDYKDVITNALLTFYVTYFAGTLINIRTDYGVFAVLLVFICAWMTDTGAYFIGCFFGKRKLIPKVSPKKTVEGAIGGIIVCMICNVIYINVLGLISSQSILYTLLFSVIISVVSQFGDLAASAIKRDCKVKDFGNLLPGHGGLMDRFDSVTFIAPIMLFLLKFM